MVHDYFSVFLDVSLPEVAPLVAYKEDRHVHETAELLRFFGSSFMGFGLCGHRPYSVRP